VTERRRARRRVDGGFIGGSLSGQLCGLSYQLVQRWRSGDIGIGRGVTRRLRQANSFFPRSITRIGCSFGMARSDGTWPPSDLCTWRCAED
jgi:hypothetical protein